MLRIALCGAGGVGKGTLARRLAAGLKLNFLPSTIEDIGRRMYPKTGNYTEIADRRSFQYAILMAQIEGEQLFGTLDSEGFIAERSVLDYLPYAGRVFGEGSEGYRDYERIVREHLATGPYDLLVFVPLEFKPTAADLKQNSWKERDPQSQKDTDAFLDEFIASLPDSLPTVKVTGTVEERMQQVLGALKGK